MNRRQRVSLRLTNSSWLPVLSGVPQGSVLGPLLFAIYVDDIDTCLPDCVVTKFADDIKVYADVSAAPSLQNSIDSILSWAKTWLLNVHPQKCSVLHLGFNNQNIPYYLNDFPFHRVNQIRDLGILLDNNIKWTPQCIKVAKRAHSLLTIISKSFVSREPTTLLKIYKAYVLPILDYVSPVWCPYLVRDIETIEKVQKRFTRLFPNTRKLGYRERLSALGLHSLQTRRLRQDLVSLQNG
jgi:hypothetical protein